MSLLHTIREMSRPLTTDRELPPAAGTPPDAFEALYARQMDPWGVLTSPIAQQRYLRLVEIVGQLAPCGSILDAGCGEGSLTRYLVGCATEVWGIDASATAISRARQLVPRATFRCCTLEALDTARRFDVVLAVEVLYYVASVDRAIEKLLSIGRHVVVSYTNRERERLEPQIERWCPARDREFHSFFGLERFGFTVAHLAAPEPGA